jgi:hypothetical protein
MKAIYQPKPHRLAGIDPLSVKSLDPCTPNALFVFEISEVSRHSKFLAMTGRHTIYAGCVVRDVKVADIEPRNLSWRVDGRSAVSCSGNHEAIRGLYPADSLHMS